MLGGNICFCNSYVGKILCTGIILVIKTKSLVFRILELKVFSIARYVHGRCVKHEMIYLNCFLPKKVHNAITGNICKCNVIPYDIVFIIT